jgi:hypothetical protein
MRKIYILALPRLGVAKRVFFYLFNPNRKIRRNRDNTIEKTQYCGFRAAELTWHLVRIDILLPVATFFAILGGLTFMGSHEGIGMLLFRAGMFAAAVNTLVSIFYAILAYE